MKNVVAVFSFGTGDDGPNPRLAQYGASRANRAGQALWLDPYLEFYAPYLKVVEGVAIGKVSEPPYISLVRCAHALAAFAQQNRVKEILVVAARPVEPRLRRDLKKMLPEVAFRFESPPGLKPFSRGSRHPQTTAWWRWWMYEAQVLGASVLCWRWYAKKAGLSKAELSELGL